MYPLLIASLIFTSPARTQASQPVVLDGQSTLWTEQTALRSFRCPDGSDAQLEFTQKRGSPPTITLFRLRGRDVLGTSRAAIDRLLQQFRTVESVSPRCLRGGGVQVLLGGLRREPGSGRVVFSLKADERGHISLIR